MSNNFITKISPSVRLLIVLFIILILLLAKSIYLIAFITILTLILSIITDKKVNLYVKALKKTTLFLLFILVAYIIILKQYNIISITVFCYKLVIISTLINILFFNTDFRGIHEGLYGILSPLKNLNLDVDKISLNITLSIWFLKFLIESKDKLKVSQTKRTRKSVNIKQFIFPRVLYAINELDVFQSNLKTKFYKTNYKKSNFLSKMLFGLFLLLFIVCLFKEVIL